MLNMKETKYLKIIAQNKKIIDWEIINLLIEKYLSKKFIFNKKDKKKFIIKIKIKVSIRIR